MNAHEYLRFLEICFDNEDIDKLFNQLSKYGKLRSAQTGDKQFEVDYNDPLKLARETLGTNNYKEVGTLLIRKFVFRPILSSIPVSASKKLENIPIGVLPIRSVNAHVLKSPNGEPLIILDQGLMLMSQHYIEAIFSAAAISEKYNIEMATKHLFDTYLFILNYFAVMGEADYPENMVELPSEILILTSLYAMSIETFALCHELAHIYAGHLEKSSAKNFNIVKNSGATTDFYQMSQKQEFEADAIAWEWYLMTIKNQELLQTVDPTWALYFFTLLSLVERNLGIPDKYSTHPPAQERLIELLVRWNPKRESSEGRTAFGIWEATCSVPGPEQFKEYSEFVSKNNG